MKKINNEMKQLTLQGLHNGSIETEDGFTYRIIQTQDRFGNLIKTELHSFGERKIIDLEIYDGYIHPENKNLNITIVQNTDGETLFTRYQKQLENGNLVTILVEDHNEDISEFQSETTAKLEKALKAHFKLSSEIMEDLGIENIDGVYYMEDSFNIVPLSDYDLKEILKEYEANK